MWFSLHQQLRNRNLTHFAHITDGEFKAQGVWLTGRTVASLPQSVSSPTNAVMIAFFTCGLHLSEQLLILQPFLKWHDFKVWPTHTHHFYKLWGAWASLVAQKIKESACNMEDPGLIPVSGRSSGEGNGNPFQYSCLENPMDQWAW